MTLFTLLDHFKPELALSATQKREVFTLRHMVYCEELCFEPLNKKRLEIDEFDEYALHCQIRHLSSSRSAGTVRLITPIDHTTALPISRFGNFTRGYDPREICEISRLAIPVWLRTKGPASHQVALTELERKSAPYLSSLLYLCCLAMMNAAGKKQVFVVMERRLARQLSRFSRAFSPVGDPIAELGDRLPYQADIATLYREMPDVFRPLYHAIVSELYPDVLVAENRQEQPLSAFA